MQKSPAALRRECRKRRRALSAEAQRRHSQQLADNAQGEKTIRNSARIAAYIAADGEIDPHPLVEILRQRGKQLFLPILRPHPRFTLWFLHHAIGDRLPKNKYGIPEPELKHGKICMPWSLNAILLPLVAFDRQCNRMGMGAGYYDRSLAYLRHRRHWRRPRLIGIAHECQKVESLPVREWDVPLDMVITEQRIYRPGGD